MANKSIEQKCSTPLVIREMQIETKIRRHFMPTGMAVRTSGKAEKPDPSNTAGRMGSSHSRFRKQLVSVLS